MKKLVLGFMLLSLICSCTTIRYYKVGDNIKSSQDAFHKSNTFKVLKVDTLKGKTKYTVKDSLNKKQGVIFIYNK